MRLTLRQWLHRLVWLIAIWAASVAVLGLAAWGLRVLMRAIGMSPP
jgi:Protein of unknown function (DUF2474).